MNHFDSLNIPQKEAVLTTEGPLLILAGAGAGKTRVIVHRILELMRRGIHPTHILAVTFTNKAAAEMRERIGKVLRGDEGLPFVSTFHSLGLTIIKEHYRMFGFTRFPAVYDRDDSLKVIKSALKSIGAADVEPRAALSVISRNKGDGITTEEFATSAQNGRERQIARAWELYEKELTKDMAMDFDDLLLKTVIFLRTNPDIRTQYQHRWQYIHVDEYQDTNKLQSEFTGLLVGPSRHLCVVGDIDQTIYSWRGAQISNIMSFDKHYPGAKLVILDENYRSTKNILAAANEVIVKNIFRKDKHLYTNNKDGALLSLYQAFDELDEAGFIARKVGEMIAQGKKPHDFAVLYRANFQSRAIEEALLHANIPYQVLGTRFFDRREVKDTLSFIRAAIYETPPDIGRIANVPVRGIGKVTLLAMLSGKDIAGAMGEKVAKFQHLLHKIKTAAQKMTPQELVAFTMIESGIEKMLREDKIEGRERLENLRELGSLASRHATVEEFLESAALASDQDALKDNDNSVRLMTVHAAKGLEFPVVFITGLEEGLFPYERNDESAEDREEERRLMYVALTRAEEKVYLTYASFRTIFGAKMATVPSQFLSDIPDYVLELESPERLGRTIYLD